MKHIFIFIILATFVGTSCSHDNNSQDITTIDTRIRETLSFSKIFNDYEFIKLETTDSNLIANVNKLIITENNIFISSRKSIFIFDIDGNFIIRLNKYGKGEGEYINLTDFIIDKNNNIYILDRVRMKVLCYSIQGKFIMATKSQSFYLAESFTMFKNNAYAVFGDVGWNYNSRLIVYNSVSNKILARHFPIRPPYKKYQHVSGNTNFIQNDTVTYCAYAFNDTVFKLNKDNSIKPQYFIQHKSPIPENFYLKKYTDIRDFSEKAYKYNYYNSSFLSNEQLLYFTFKGQGKKFNRFATFYFPKTKKAFTTNEYIDDLYSGAHLFLNKGFNARAIHNQKIYFIIEPISFIDWFGKTLTKTKLTKHKKDLLNLMKNTKVEDNPIIIKAILK